MRTINQVFHDATFAAQGKTLLMGNDAARRADRLFHSHWNRAYALMAKEPNEAAHWLTSKLKTDYFDFLLDYLRAVAADAWNDRARLIWRTIPKPLLSYLASMAAPPAVEGLGIGFRLRKAAPAGQRVRVELQELRVAAMFGSASSDVPEEYRALFSPPTKRQVDDAILNTPFLGMTWTERVRKWPEFGPMSDEIRAGLLRGESRAQISKRLLPLMNDSRVAARRLARTEIARVSGAIQKQTTEQTLGSAQYGWERIATLDGRTRPKHAALDGKIYPIGSPEMQDVPSDWNCRCSLSPVMKSLEQMGLPPGLDDLFEPDERAAFRTGSRLTGGTPGPVSGDTKYPTWFNKQDEATKRGILGAKLYGQIKLAGRGRVSWTLALQALGVRLPDSIAASTALLFPKSPPPPPPPEDIA